MTSYKWAVRVVTCTVTAVVLLALFTFLAVQTQQHILRWRAQRLLADVHRIRLYQSNWTDAQRLMSRWGSWGHSNGTCTAATCEYEITIDNSPHHAWQTWLLAHDRFNLYQWFGGRWSAFQTSFTVHNGTIWRQGTSIGVSVPSRRMRREGDFDLSLSVGAVSYQRLHRTLENWTPFIDDSDFQLAQHPYYKIGRPSGCMINCQIGIAYYSTRTPQNQIERLSSYDFSCFTRFSPCAQLGDLLPEAKEWHLYDHAYDPVPMSAPPFPPCNKIPVWAQVRDARYVLTVEVLPTKVVKKTLNGSENQQDGARVRIIDSLKEPAPWLPGTLASMRSRDAYQTASSFNAVEPMLPGKRYIVFPIGNDRRDQVVTKDSPLTFDHCALREDTLEIQQELHKGLEQNDSMNP